MEYKRCTKEKCYCYQGMINYNHDLFVNIFNDNTLERILDTQAIHYCNFYLTKNELW